MPDDAIEEMDELTRTRYGIGALLFALGAALRAFFYPVVTSDYSSFLHPWFMALKSAGFAAFSQPFADYAPLYLYLLRLLAYLPVPDLYSIKSLSVLFDLILAFFVYRIVRDAARPVAGLPFLAAGIAFIAPTLLVNSSLWGQSDSVYAAGIAASLYYLLRLKPFPGVLAFSLACAVKVQAIFFLPVIVGYLCAMPRKLPYLLVIPGVFLLSLLPAVLSGGSLSYWGLIYLHQSAEYPWLSLSAPSVYAFTDSLPLGALATPLFYAGLVAASLVGFFIAVYIAGNLSRMGRREFVLLALLCVLLIPFFLPRMHERYFYLADLLSVVYAFFAPRQWYVAVAVVLASLLSYAPYLSGQLEIISGVHMNLMLPAAMLLLVALLLLATIPLLRRRAKEERALPEGYARPGAKAYI